MRHIDDAERRHRLARRQALTPATRARDIAAATAALTAWHATDVPTVYLALRARVEGLALADVDRALYDERSIVRQLAMRRTLFGFSRDVLPAVLGSASARVARTQRQQLLRDLARYGVSHDPVRWLERAVAATLEHLSDGRPRSARELRTEVAELAGRLVPTGGERWAVEQPVAPRVLTLLSAEGRVMRAHNDGHWRISRPTWCSTAAWLGEEPEPTSEAEGYVRLVSGWLRGFGPGTETDLAWWLGATKTAVRRALAEVGAVRVALDGGAEGWVLPDDLEPEPPAADWVALLPVLDPTTMGWKQRGFYLGADEPRLFDRNGNGGTTAWWNGEVVGVWIQDAEGVVSIHLLRAVPREVRIALDEEAARLTAWCAGDRVASIWVSPAMKEAAAGLPAG